MQHKKVKTSVLNIAYLEFGQPDGWPCVLCHGFPYDPLCYTDAATLLASNGARVIVPWLRGYGPTKFVSTQTPRSGEQAALAADLLDLLDALSIKHAVLAGFDWGGRAACIVSALFPERVKALVTVNGYNLQNIALCNQPEAAHLEAGYWYQYYFHNERGLKGLMSNRDQICKLLWQQWSPDWSFSDEIFHATAHSFQNPDFVDVVIHSYRHRFALAPGDPAYAHLETQLTSQPDINIPTIIIDGESDGVNPPDTSTHKKFTQLIEYRLLPGIGHNPAQEDPVAWSDAILSVKK